MDTKFSYQEQIQDIDFMPDVLAAESIQEKQSGVIFLWGIFATFAVLIIWAMFAEVDELTRGVGKVVPSSQVQQIGSLEGGTLKKLYVKENDIVKKGQPLLAIDNTIQEAKKNEGKILFYRLTAQVARLRAQISGNPFVVPETVIKNAPMEEQDALRSYQTHQENVANEVRIAEQEVEQKQQEYNELISRQAEMEKQLDINTKKIAIIKPLVEKQIEPQISLLDLERDSSRLRGDTEGIKSQILKSKASLSQAQDKLKQVPIKFKADDWRELKDASNALANAQESYITESHRSDMLEIDSPVHGIVKLIKYNTIGGTIKPDDTIMEVVPLEDTLLVEARVQPQDVAFLRPGMPVSVKVSAYDYSIYGDLKGELERVSADTILDEKGNAFYKVYVRTEGSRLSKAKRDLPIMPGMVANIDIMTGKKTVMQYLLKPLVKAKYHALTER